METKVTEAEVQKLIEERNFYKKAYEDLLRLISTGALKEEPGKTISDEAEFNFLSDKVNRLTTKRLIILSALLLSGASAKALAEEMGTTQGALNVATLKLRNYFNVSSLHDLKLIKLMKDYDAEKFLEKTGVPKDWWDNRDQYRDIVKHIRGRSR